MASHVNLLRDELHGDEGRLLAQIGLDDFCRGNADQRGLQGLIGIVALLYGAGEVVVDIVRQQRAQGLSVAGGIGRDDHLEGGAPTAKELVLVEAAIRQLDLGEGGGRSEEHTSELQSLMRTSYAVFC